jgi:transposase-like protein
MQWLGFEEWFAMVSAIRLSAADLARLREWIAGIADPAECLALIERMALDRPCPHCRHPRRHRCGEANGLQRFRCLGCRRTFNALTGTPLARLRKRERWLAYLQCVHQPRARLPADRTRPQRANAGFSYRTRTGDSAATARLPGALLSADALLVSDAAAAYRTFAMRAHITHEAVNVRAGERARGAIHIQNVNAWHSRFKGWLVRFRGVASRYLINYSGWLRMLDARKLMTPSQLLCSACSLDASSA